MPGEMFWEFHQQGRIDEAMSEASGARRKSNELGREVHELCEKVDRLSLACQAMWELLRDQGSFREDQLLDKIQEVDLRDGRADGKIGAQPIECVKCGRKTNSRRQNCMYCGVPLQGGQEHIFE
jgi:hypothetical protein